ncbi:MAG: HAD-IIA family hydrolase [Actinomycetia bacterium]|nr:HAD-IIA family hydrolase [Actinomycetes bacterium]
MTDPVVLDLDGVVWLAESPIPGSADAVARLRQAGRRVVFVTNNSSALVSEQEAKLASFGIPAEGDVITSAAAAATLVQPGERVICCSGPGVVEAVRARGAEVVDDGPADAVVVGFHMDFDYDGLRRAGVAVMNGARLVATNHDPTYPTPDGPIPGGGSIVAAVATAAGVEPEFAGKPRQPVADLVRQLVGDAGMVVGDRPDSDGEFATTLGFEFGLVLSGVTAETDLPVSPEPTLVAEDLAALVDQILGSDPDVR